MIKKLLLAASVMGPVGYGGVGGSKEEHMLFDFGAHASRHGQFPLPSQKEGLGRGRLELHNLKHSTLHACSKVSWVLWFMVERGVDHG